MLLAAIGDVHLGSVKTDYKSLEQLLQRLAAMMKDTSYARVVFVGDLIDSTNMYRTQRLHQLPGTMDYQRAMLVWLDEQLPSHAEKIVVLGNHERNADALNTVDLLKLLGWKIYRQYYCEMLKLADGSHLNVCFVHTSAKRLHGSRVVGKTPMLQYFDYVVARDLGADILITAHTHKMFNKIVFGGIQFIMLPSFEYDSNSPGEAGAFTPTIWTMDGEGRERLLYVNRTIRYLHELESYNRVVIARILEEYIDRYQVLVYTG